MSCQGNAYTRTKTHRQARVGSEGRLSTMPGAPCSQREDRATPKTPRSPKQTDSPRWDHTKELRTVCAYSRCAHPEIMGRGKNKPLHTPVCVHEDRVMHCGMVPGTSV